MKVVYEEGGDLDKVFAVGIFPPVTSYCIKDEAFEIWCWGMKARGGGRERGSSVVGMP